MIRICLTALFVMLAPVTVRAQPTTQFTYQGSLSDGGSPANGMYYMEFSLYNSNSGGPLIGGPWGVEDVEVIDGLFSVEIDFGSAMFDDGNPWLAISVEGQPLTPRQRVTGVPYSFQTRGIAVDGQERVAIGTATPFADLHIQGNQTSIRLDDLNSTASYTELTDVTDSQFKLNKHAATGAAFLDLNPNPLNGTSPALIRHFRDTNTTGEKALRLYRGDGTATPSASIGVDGTDSYFQRYGGSVGIGTNGPESLLHLHQRTQTSGDPLRMLVLDSHDDFNDFDLTTGSGPGILFKVPYQNDSRVGAAIDAVRTTNVEIDSSTALVFSTSVNDQTLTEAMRIDDDGKVGIGTTNPRARFHVESDDGWSIEAETHDGSSAIYATNWTPVGPANGITGSAVGSSSAGMYGVASGTNGYGIYGYAYNNAAYGVYGYCEDAAGYDFFAGGAGINYGAASSIRWKRNIELIEDPLGMLAQIRAVYYDWDEEHGGGRDIGFIGEEVGKVVPEIVAFEEGGEFVTGMDYGRMTPLLVEAVKELRAEKDAEISELNERIAQLERMITAQSADALAASEKKGSTP